MSFESHFNKYWDNEFKNFILQHKDKEWNSNLGYINPNISWELFNDEELNKNGIFGEESIFNLYIQGYSNLWFYLILYSKVSIGKILELYNAHQFWLDYEVMWKLLSRHNDITMDYVFKNNTYNWNFEELSRHKNIKLKNIEDNINLPWNFDQMSHNPNINYNFVKKYNYKKWNYKGLSDNKGIYWDDILYNLEQKWNWDRVTRNINSGGWNFPSAVADATGGAGRSQVGGLYDDIANTETYTQHASWLDAPATALSVSYRIEMMRWDGTMYMNRPDSNTNGERNAGITSITIMEVQQ